MLPRFYRAHESTLPMQVPLCSYRESLKQQPFPHLLPAIETIYCSCVVRSTLVVVVEAVDIGIGIGMIGVTGMGD